MVELMSKKIMCVEAFSMSAGSRCSENVPLACPSFLRCQSQEVIRSSVFAAGIDLAC